MTVLITGAAGLLGQELVRKFSDERHIACTHADLDITDAGAVGALLAAERPDVVINAAAWTDVDACEADPDRAHAVNAQGPGNLARACASIGATVLTISTDYVFGADDNGRRPFDEHAPIAPLNVYGAAKAAGEAQVREATAAHQIVRTSWVYGAARPTFASAMLARARRGEALAVAEGQWSTPTSARDLAVAVAEIARSRSFGTFHRPNAGWCSRVAYALEVCRAAELDVEVRAVDPSTFPSGAPRPAWSVLGDTRTREAGFSAMRPWQEALRDAVVRGDLDRATR
ncbi:MAG: dTDP-4-dehydrorhamnose reductase [Nitriliruptoraceae bacterium]